MPEFEFDTKGLCANSPCLVYTSIHLSSVLVLIDTSYCKHNSDSQLLEYQTKPGGLNYGQEIQVKSILDVKVKRKCNLQV